jgi:HEPN domain-containing protein
VAQEDRRVAAVCLTIDPPMRGAAAFHCQQAVEKLLKGFLTLAGKRGGKTHSLARLGNAAASFPEIADLVAAAKSWSNWAVEFRYPSRRGRAQRLPDEDELRPALAVIDAPAARLRAANPEPQD